MLTALVGGVPEPISHIAPDPFEQAFDDDGFATRLRGANNRDQTGPARPVADQRGRQHLRRRGVLAGAAALGAPTQTLTAPKVTELLAAVRAVMAAALRQGGTSFDSLYVNVNGESGYFERSLEVYGRRDQPCSRCGTPIRRDPFMNRSSYICPAASESPAERARRRRSRART